MEATQIPTNRWIDKNDVARIQDEILFSFYFYNKIKYSVMNNFEYVFMHISD